MTVYIGGKMYVPGAYAKSSIPASELADKCIREWDKRHLEEKEKGIRPEIYPSICFSRKIGAGALEIADILAEKIRYRVVDREILEHIAKEAKLSEKTVGIFDERYPGEIREFLSMAFGEKSFIESSFARHLAKVVYSISGLGPTLFVGRGVHLVLPRDRVLAVRFICSKEYRIERLAGFLGIKKEEAETKLNQIDKEQRDFFKKVYGKKDASPYEFDMVINCDYIREPQSAAEIVAHAFRQKFGPEIC